MHRVLVLAASAAVLLPTALAAAGNDDVAVRAMGVAGISTDSTTVNSINVFCVEAGANATVKCDLDATGVMRVGAAAQNKLGLSSPVLARAGKAVPCGESTCLRMKVSKTALAKLKKVSSLKVLYRIAVSSPISETISDTVTMKVSPSGGGPRLLLRSNRDTFAFGSGRE
jgi:hypothetical protein